jgi:hypothetical protein
MSYKGPGEQRRTHNAAQVDELKKEVKLIDPTLNPNLSIMPDILKRKKVPQELLDKIEKRIHDAWYEGAELHISVGDLSSGYTPYTYRSVVQISLKEDPRIYSSGLVEYFNSIGYQISFKQRYLYESIKSDPYVDIIVIALDDLPKTMKPQVNPGTSVAKQTTEVSGPPQFLVDLSFLLLVASGIATIIITGAWVL